MYKWLQQRDRKYDRLNMKFISPTILEVSPLYWRTVTKPSSHSTAQIISMLLFSLGNYSLIGMVEIVSAMCTSQTYGKGGKRGNEGEAASCA